MKGDKRERSLRSCHRPWTRHDAGIGISLLISGCVFAIFSVWSHVISARETRVSGLQLSAERLWSSFALRGGRNMEAKGEAFSTLQRAVLEPRDRKLVLHCRGGCRGIADRVRGMLFGSMVAYVSGREFVMDRSLLSYVLTPPEGPHYWFEDQCSTPVVVENLRRLVADRSPVLYITSACRILPPWEELIAAAADERLPILRNVSSMCTQERSDVYRCGAAVFRAAASHVPEFQKGLADADRIIRTFRTFLDVGNYTVIQIRAGGSSIYVDGSRVPSVPWPDDYVSEIPNLWIQAFQSFTYTNCKGSVVVISDSARVLGEIWHAARDKLTVTHCCSQPLHRDRARSRPDEFYLQEIVDLSIMDGSQTIVAGNGNFATLGQYWRERETPPTLIRAHTRTAIYDAFLQILQNCECENIVRPSDG